MIASSAPVIVMRTSFDTASKEQILESKKSDLSESEMTSQTASVSEEEGWFGGMGADFRTLACSIKDTAGGVASYVQRSAMSVAAEIAAMEPDEEEDSPDRSLDESEPLKLPWEIRGEDSTYVEDPALKEKILKLSLNEKAFLEPCSNEEDSHDAGFVLDERRIQLIRSLLEIDDNLASLHAKLSGRSDFDEFALWREYFYECEVTKKNHVELYGSTADVISVASHVSQNSLVPAESGDESSFVCVNPTSPPSSLNSWAWLSASDRGA